MYNYLQEALNRIEKAKSARLTSLNFTELGLTSIPLEIQELTWLTSLFASFNAFSDLEPIRHLSNLERVDFRGNRLYELHSLSNLVHLKYLDLAGNSIQDISPLNSLIGLETLYLSENQISNLSPLRSLSNLKHLFLSENLLVDISPLEESKELLELDVSKNKIGKISPLSHSLKLKKLNISNNSIADIKSLHLHKELKEFYFGDNKINDLTPIKNLIAEGIIIRSKSKEISRPSQNPLKIPPPEIVEKGNLAISNYYSELQKQGSGKIFEAKLIIVGEGGAGKTSLARKIENSASPLPKEDESTMGIDVRQLHIMKMPSGEPFLLNIWDFGGQEIYHSTHQFFLTHRSLYILVDDTRKDSKSVNDEVFSYWLQIVELLGGNSPLLIVQNEKSDRSKQIDLNSMQARFSFIKDLIPTNLATNRGLEHVHNAIKQWLKRLEHVGETLPIQWLKIRKDISTLSKAKENISLEKYFDICRKNDIPELDRALSLSSYLHDLGTFLHFQNDLILKNIVILNNSWATDAVYALLDDEIIKRKLGYFTKDDVDRLWSSDKYQFHHHELMALMEKFELCYKIFDKSPPTWLAPQLLPVGISKLDWDNEGNLVVRYEYGFMPKGILPRLIVRLNRYIKDIETTWRSGVILERQKTFALVTETYSRKEIVIRVLGYFPKDLMTIVTEELDQINESFKRLEVEKMIPCNFRVCRNQNAPHFYRYSNLMERIRRNKATTECDLSYENVDVRALLGGLFTTVVGKRYEDMKVFISYSHKDNDYKTKLQTHLKTLKLTHHLEVWDDSEISAGENWEEKIHINIRESDIILFLISADFINSNYIWEKELPVAIERNNRRDAIVIPIFIRECDTEGLEFMKLQGLPKNGRSVNSYKDPDEAYSEIVKGIRKRISTMPRW